MDINGICHSAFCGRLEARFPGRAILYTTCPGLGLAKPDKSRLFSLLTVHSRPRKKPSAGRCRCPHRQGQCSCHPHSNSTPGVSGWPPVFSAPVPCGKGNRPACVPAAASLYRGYLSCVPSILLSVAVLPEKASCLVVASCVSLVSPQAAKLTCSAAPPLPTKPYGFAGAPTIAACSGVGTLPATSGHFVPKSGSLRCFPSRGIPFRTVILFSRCCPSMNYPKSTRKKCNPRNIARIAF